MTHDEHLSGLATGESNEALRYGYSSWRKGRALARKGNHVEALRRFKEARDFFDTEGERLESLRVSRDHIHSLEMLGCYSEAIALVTECRSLLGSLDSPHDLAHLDVQEANVRHLIHDHKEALRLYRRAKVFFEGEGDLVMTSRIEISLGNILTYIGELEDAEKVYCESRERLQEAGEPLRVAIADSNLGLNLTFQGRYLEAVMVYERARKAFDELGARDRLAMVDLNFSDLYLELNLFEEAERHCRTALEIFRELGQDYYYGLACLNLYFVRRGRMQPLKWSPDGGAEDLLTKAQGIFLEHSGEVWAAIVDMHHALLLLSRGMMEEALDRAINAWHDLRDKGVHSYAYWAQLIVAQIRQESGDLDQSQRLNEEVIEYASRHNIDTLKLGGLHGTGRVWEKKRFPLRAMKTYAEAIDIVEKVRTNLKLEDFRSSFICDKVALYEDMVRLALDGNMRRTALDYVERSRSRVMLDFLSEHIGLGMDVGLRQGGGAGTAEISSLRESLNRLYVKARCVEEQDGTTEAEVERVALVREIQDKEVEYQYLLREMALARTGSDKLGQAMGLSEIDPADTIWRVDPGLVILEYFVLDGEVILFALKRGDIKVFRGLCQIDDIMNTMHELYNEFSDIGCLDPEFVRDNTSSLNAPSLEILRDWEMKLLAPAADRIGDAERLLIIPHNLLHHLPFHAFFDGKSHAVERWEIHYSPSLQVHASCMKRRIVGDSAPLLVGITDGQLPFVETEIEAIAGVLHQPRILKNEEATLEAFTNLAGGASIIHLSCHARFRWDNPLFSYLQLYDGRLTAHDIYDLALRCNLVVLSGCETGVAEVRPGDELMGLCRAFFLAGAPSMVLSLWPVNDRSTAELIKTFYTGLERGEGIGRALRRAQLKTMSQFPHPYYWAPFILHGRG